MGDSVTKGACVRYSSARIGDADESSWCRKKVEKVFVHNKNNGPRREKDNHACSTQSHTPRPSRSRCVLSWFQTGGS